MFYSAFTYLSALLGHTVTKRQQALNELYLFSWAILVEMLDIFSVANILKYVLIQKLAFKIQLKW